MEQKTPNLYGKSATPVLVSDFDGTMTRRDFFDLVRTELKSTATSDYWQDYVDGRITHFQALAGIFSHVETDERQLIELVDRMELDPTLKASVERLRAAGWDIVVASAGCAWYIDRLLAQAGIQLTVHANPGVFRAGAGLVMREPVDSPYYTASTGIDKDAIVRDAVRSAPRAAFAGDGRPDFSPALQVPPRLRFARGWLAHHLKKKGETFQEFNSWSDIADRLIEEV